MFLTNPANIHQVARVTQQERLQSAARQQLQTAVQPSNTAHTQPNKPQKMTFSQILLGLARFGEGLVGISLINLIP